MPVRIAVINDDQLFLELLEDLLSEQGYEVVTAITPASALDWLRAQRPALLVLDLRLDSSTAGWDILAAMRREPDLQGLPVIVCSADLAALLARAAELGLLGAVPMAKPIDIEELIALVQRLTASQP